MKMTEFLSQHTVFTVEELDRFLSIQGSGNPSTRKSLLTHYGNQGRIIRVRRGLYATVPAGADPVSSPADPYLVAAKLTADAVLAYHTSLEFHGKAYSVYTRLCYISACNSLPLKFQHNEYKRASSPSRLSAKGKEMFGVTSHKRSGVVVKVTNLERTLVDVLDRPELTGSWEEIWRSLESVEFFDPVLDLHELAAGKLAALFARGQARDLFDCHKILNMDNIERDLLRIGFVVYGGMNRKDWRTVSIEDVNLEAVELARQLIPTLHFPALNELISAKEYGTQLVEECRKALSIVLPFTDAEREFLDLLLDQGVIDPTNLTNDKSLRLRIKGQPLLEWKALNVRDHKGLS